MDYSIDNLKIIGVTGTVGKTSVTELTYQFLKFLGKRVIKYNSLGIDSPASFALKGLPFEGSVTKELNYVQVIKEAEAYKADYVVIEVSEEALRLGSVDNIHFDVKLLTRFYSGWHRQITTEDYFLNKSRFFEDDEESICLFNLQTDLIDRFYSRCNGIKKLYDTGGNENGYLDFYQNYRQPRLPDELKNVEVSYYTNWGIGGIDKSYANYHTPHGDYEIHTTLATYFHTGNILSAIAIIDALNLFDKEKFSEFISNPELELEGRMQDFQFAGRTVIVDYDQFNPYVVCKEIRDGELNIAKQRYKNLFGVDFITQEIGRVVAVASAVSSSNAFARKWALDNPQYDKVNYPLGDYSVKPNYSLFSNNINTRADKCYLTVDSPGDRLAEDIINDIIPYITIPVIGVPDRKQAIRKAIMESEQGDLIIISGRGNRRAYFTSPTEFEMFSDIDIVKATISEFEAPYDN